MPDYHAFIADHGPPPWDEVNHLIQTAGLPYQVTKPDLLEFGLYDAQLEKAQTEELVPFSVLSSGEQILLSFALLLFNLGRKGGRHAKPSLILLDEVDAPLHPAMSQALLDIIEKAILPMGVNVIATTHSPSTIALAPDESIFVMERGVAGLRKFSKSEALNALTVGVPTVALDYHGRRQVFAESKNDAEVFSILYDQLRSRLPAGRSLEFISTGNAEGCGQVKKWVRTLTDAGNVSVFGLIDSDKGVNRGTSRIAILSAGHRDGLENLLLDPLLVAAWICHSGVIHLPDIGLSRTFSLRDLVGADANQLQDIVDKVTARIFRNSATSSEKVSTSYMGDFSLDLDKRCLDVDDHEYEALVKSAFPALQKSKILHEIARNIIREVPSFTPMHLIDTLSDLLGRPSHA